jgi:aminopeptidase S
MPMPSLRSAAALLLILLLSGFAGDDRALSPADAVPASVSIASAWHEDVTAISSHASSEGRREALLRQLDTSGLAATALVFSARELEGTNLLVAVSGDASLPLLLVGAHYDQVEVGNGVTDNASGSGVVLALARRFQQRPLRHHRVAAAFWDLEENGLLGANAYVTGGGERPALYVNFDVFGWGDTVWMMTPEPEHPLVEASAQATASRSLRLSSGDRYPPTDHLAFLRAGWPAVSYSLVGHDEIEQILQAFSGQAPATMPKVMRVIHTEHDTIEQVDAAAVEAAIDAIEAALREWDAAHAG